MINSWNELAGIEQLPMFFLKKKLNSISSFVNLRSPLGKRLAGLAQRTNFSDSIPSIGLFVFGSVDRRKYSTCSEAENYELSTAKMSPNLCNRVDGS